MNPWDIIGWLCVGVVGVVVSVVSLALGYGVVVATWRHFRVLSHSRIMPSIGQRWESYSSNHRLHHVDIVRDGERIVWRWDRPMGASTHTDTWTGWVRFQRAGSWYCVLDAHGVEESASG